MESKAKLLGHPIHQMLVVFPLGLLADCRSRLTLSVLFAERLRGRHLVLDDAAGIIEAIGGNGSDSLTGWLFLLAREPRRLACCMVGENVVVTLLFIISWLLRRPAPENPGFAAFAASFVAVLLALVTGWLGGELVDRLGVGVHTGAHLNAPSSLSGRPARDDASEAKPPQVA